MLVGMNKIWVSIGLFVFPLCLVTAGESGPLNIHATWSGNPCHEVTVSWRTRDMRQTSRVKWIDAQGQEHVTTGESFSSAGGYQHHVRLTDLEPDTVYRYRVEDEAGLWGPECRFRTAPFEADSFTFAVIGDVQGKEQPSSLWQKAGAWLAQQENVLFAWLMGDLVDTGFSQTQWDAFFNSLEPEHRKDLFHSMVIMPLIGNHDTYGGEGNKEGVKLYLDQFRLPSNGQGSAEGFYYSFDVAGARFIALDTEAAVEDARAHFARQTQWLAGLDWAPSAWTFVAHHRPVHPIRRHVPSDESRFIWRPHFFEPYVHLVFNGHNHSQAVTFPMRVAQLDCMNGGKGFAGPWKARVDRNCPSGMPGIFLLEENERITYPGYETVGRSLSTRRAGTLAKTAMQAERALEPVELEPDRALWIGYLYQKREGWYAENLGGWRFTSNQDPSRFLQIATIRVHDPADNRFGHLELKLGDASAITARALAPEGLEHIPEQPFFVLARIAVEGGKTKGTLKFYQAPESMPSAPPSSWDAELVLDEPWEVVFDTLTLLGEDKRRHAWIDELRVGRRMEDVLLRPLNDESPGTNPLIEERFDAYDAGPGVVYYDAGGINSSGPAGDYGYIRFRETGDRMPLVGIFTVTRDEVVGRTVLFDAYESWQAGDVLDEFRIPRVKQAFSSATGVEPRLPRGAGTSCPVREPHREINR